MAADAAIDGGWDLLVLRKIHEYVRRAGAAGESIRYIIAGVLTTLVNFGLFALLTRVAGIPVTISNIMSISAAILFAYIVNKLFVFRRRRDSVAALVVEFFKFIGARLFSMALEVGAVPLFVHVFGQADLLGKGAAQALVLITNFFISKLIVFRRERS